jgi:hypothetical protein
MTLVTQQSLIALVCNDNKSIAYTAVGRALVALHERQTLDEQVNNGTVELNGVGFTGADAHAGSLTAKYFIRHKTLTDWQYAMWVKSNKHGIPRIAKYWKQLNDVAVQKQQSRQNQLM